VEWLGEPVAITDSNLAQPDVSGHEVRLQRRRPELRRGCEPLVMRPRVGVAVGAQVQLGELQPERRLVGVPLDVGFEVGRGAQVVVAPEALRHPRERVVVRRRRGRGAKRLDRPLRHGRRRLDGAHRGRHRGRPHRGRRRWRAHGFAPNGPGKK
jgi:hypothetical protein